MLGLIAGADSLDEMDRLAQDNLFSSLNSYVNSANTYGDYLRSFTGLQCKRLNRLLIETSLSLRKAMFPNASDFILDIDSFSSEQSGEKIEGVEFNYKNEWCLDSLAAFDQFGFQYWLDVRPGATFTSNGAPEVIHTVFKMVSSKLRRFLRADSGFCNVDVFNAARCAEARFVIAMRENIYDPLIRRVKNWERTSRVKFRDGRSCEIGSTVYKPKEGTQILRVVFIRALKEGEQRRALFNDAQFDYAAWVTNLGHHELSNEKIIEFYRGRGNAENFIREAKYGFDLKHYPCQKLLANKAYGLIAAFAYTLMRYTGFILNKDKPHYSKIIRFRMIHLACQVVRHAGMVTIRFFHIQLKEVQCWLEKIHLQFGFG
jgi:hypothetical protein